MLITQALANNFIKLDLSLHKFQKLTFDQQSVKLRQQDVVETSARMREHVISLIDSGGDEPLRTLHIKYFLAGWMIIANPHRVFENVHGEQEKSLMKVAESLITCYCRTCYELSEGTTWSTALEGIAKDLPGLMKNYINEFSKWVNEDVKKIAGRLVKRLEALKLAKLDADKQEVAAVRMRMMEDVEKELNILCGYEKFIRRMVRFTGGKRKIDCIDSASFRSGGAGRASGGPAT